MTVHLLYLNSARAHAVAKIKWHTSSRLNLRIARKLVTLRGGEQLCRSIWRVDARGKGNIAGLGVFLPRHTMARDGVDDLYVVDITSAVFVSVALEGKRGAVAAAREEGIDFALAVLDVAALCDHWVAGIAKFGAEVALGFAVRFARLDAGIAYCEF